MQQITAAQFWELTDTNPAWATQLTEPVEIPDYCDMRGSKITHLSTYLHFTGRDERKWAAAFTHCKSLKIAEGNFRGYVNFGLSGIEKIGDLIITDTDDNAASFWNCQSLKVAEGHFPHHVYFHDSKVEKIGNLVIDQPNLLGKYANFACCSQLHTMPERWMRDDITIDTTMRQRLNLLIQQTAAAKKLIKNSPDLEI